jgi:hypothetical protein
MGIDPEQAQLLGLPLENAAIPDTVPTAIE